MFEIEYLGGNALKISSKGAVIVIDGKRSVFGGKDVVVSGGVSLGTEARTMATSTDFKLSVSGPGEYEVGDVMIKGIAAKQHLDDPTGPERDSTMYSLMLGGERLAVLGNIWGELSDKQLEALGVVDILVLPVGGHGYTLDADEAIKLIGQIDPKLVIPVHYAAPGLNYEVAQDGLEEFVTKLKAPVVEEKTLKIKSGAVLPAALEVHKLAIS